MIGQAFSQQTIKTHLLRLEKGEELVSSLTEYITQNQIKLGMISGIGATDKFQLGLFNPQTKAYLSTEYQTPVEITSLLGNCSTMNGETYLHLHANMGDEQNQVLGGHLNYAWISATAEIIIQEIDGEVDRFFSEEIGLNLLKLT